jgi:hypothetical protein
MDNEDRIAASDWRMRPRFKKSAPEQKAQETDAEQARLFAALEQRVAEIERRPDVRRLRLELLELQTKAAEQRAERAAPIELPAWPRRHHAA